MDATKLTVEDLESEIDSMFGELKWSQCEFLTELIRRWKVLREDVAKWEKPEEVKQ